MDAHKILIVDDELLIRDLLYDYFLSKDYSIMTANSAEEAMDILEQHDDFDVVLTDIKMGGIDGLQLVEDLRQDHGNLPVIVMTAFPSVETAVEALRKRDYDYIVKPFNINRLYSVVEAAAKQYQRDRKVHVQEVVNGE
jgi:DNA-binding NtrC family response regulator